MKGNHRNPQPVMPVYNRKIARNRLKMAIGNSKIQKAWRRSQIKVFGGIVAYVRMRMRKAPWNQHKEVAYQLYNGL